MRLMPTLIIRTLLLYGALSVMGGWLWLLLRRLAPEVWRPPAALLGIVVAQFVGWYWSAQVGRGLFSLWPFVFVGTCAASATLAWRERISLGRMIRSPQAWATEVTTACISFALFAVLWRTILSRPI
jgi:hypothetical protein